MTGNKVYIKVDDKLKTLKRVENGDWLNPNSKNKKKRLSRKKRKTIK
jgi:hypothetical protein